MTYENPYLIELLKKAIQFDTMNMYDISKATITRIGDYIVSRQETYYSQTTGICKAAGTFADNVKKAWSNKNFEYGVVFLDMLTTASMSLGKYDKWDEFVETHGCHPCAIKAEQFRGQLFSKLSASIQNDIILDVYRNFWVIRNASRPLDSSYLANGNTLLIKNLAIRTDKEASEIIDFGLFKQNPNKD